MSSDGFENRLKQRLEDAEIAPPEELWGQIASGLEPQRRRKRFLFWYLLGIFILLLIASALTIPHIFAPQKGEQQIFTASEADATHTGAQNQPDDGLTTQITPGSESPIGDRNNIQQYSIGDKPSESLILKHISTEAYLPKFGVENRAFPFNTLLLTTKSEKPLGIIDSIYFSPKWDRHVDFRPPHLSLEDPWALPGKWSLSFWTGISFGSEANFLSAMEADLSSYSPGEDVDSPGSEGSNTFPLIWQREYPRQNFYLGSNLAYQLNPKLSLQADLSLAMSQQGSQSLTSVDLRAQAPNLSDLPSQTTNRNYRIWQFRSMLGVGYHLPLGPRSSWVNGFHLGGSYFTSTSIEVENQLIESLDPNLYNISPRSGQLQRWELLLSFRSQYHYKLSRRVTLFAGPFWEWNPGTRDNFNSTAKTSFNHQLGIQLGLKLNR